jgi:MFS family permease
MAEIMETGKPAGVFATLRATPAPVRYLLTGVLINQTGAFVQTFLVLYLTVHGLSAGRAGIAVTVYSAGAVLGALLGAELAHRIGPRATIACAMTTSALIIGCIPWLSRPALFGVLLAALAAGGLATQCYRPAAAVMLSELMPAEHRVMAFSMMRIALNIGAALSPLIAAGLILVNWNVLFWMDAGTALAYAALARTLLPGISAAPQEPDGAGDKRPGYLALLRDWKYLLFLASVLLGSVIYVQYAVTLPLKIRSDGHPTAVYSALLTMSSLILILCELKITTYVRRWKPYVAGGAGSAVVGIGVAGYGLGSSVAVLVPATIVFVFGVMISGPSMFAHPATFPASVKARYIGAHQAIFGLGMALGPALGVLAWEGLGAMTWLACGVIGLVAGLCALVGMRPDALAPGPEHLAESQVALAGQDSTA